MKIWWINPLNLLLRFIFPIYLLIFIIPFENVGSSPYAVQNYLDLNIFFLGIIFFLFFSFGFIFSFNNLRKDPYIVEYVSPKFLSFIGITTILAYIIWFNFLIFNPHMLIDQLTGRISAYNIRKNYTTISGLTTLSQLGVLYIVLYLQNKKKLKPSIRHKTFFRLIIILTFIRSIVWSERLAIIEVIFPIALFFFMSLEIKKTKGLMMKLVRFLPYIGIFMLLILFGFFEYFRSWSYYQKYYDNIIQFTVDRVFMYYYGAVNSAAAVLKMTHWPSLSLNSYFNWIYKFPYFGTYISNMVPAESYGDWEVFLNRYLDPEFNNPTGFLKPYWDSGILGAILFFIIWGTISKISYVHFKRGYGLGLYFFPIIFISVLECLRVPYLSESRVFPVFFFSIIGYCFFTKRLRIHPI
ncbi:O-antigen polymerase [Leeuwenhoekiella sp. A16]|uniref:O-antigen polymerase n=1 Tax=Leeuwenhoekiella sp. A16 TaxID=3141462 RepID=UPI003A8087A7